ncbi:hypothetical protein BC826DRAFT_1008463 [Russula brevipes]|nr:hypothetical protein BC826DRAFT_1008463 [Russula brevipes]
MPSNADNITLVAPRPVRLSNFSIHLPSPHRQHTLRIASTPADPVDRLFSADSPLDDDPLLLLDSDSKSPKVSPRASPRYVFVHPPVLLLPNPARLLFSSPISLLTRSSLPSEALEEFLSILRPSLFPPRSPVLRPLRYPVSSLHDRTLTIQSKPLGGIDNLSVLPREDSRTPVKQLGAPLSSRPPALYENEENDLRPETPQRSFGSGPLASPISRIHTRNPFQRHASYETSLVPAPYLPQDRALSPASVALPSPTPSELESI